MDHRVLLFPSCRSLWPLGIKVCEARRFPFVQERFHVSLDWMNRREFFKMGGLTLGAISPLGLSLPEVLANEAASPGKQINVIFMFLQGGASQLDM